MTESKAGAAPDDSLEARGAFLPLDLVVAIDAMSVRTGISKPSQDPAAPTPVLNESCYLLGSAHHIRSGMASAAIAVAAARPVEMRLQSVTLTGGQGLGIVLYKVVLEPVDPAHRPPTPIIATPTLVETELLLPDMALDMAPNQAEDPDTIEDDTAGALDDIGTYVTVPVYALNCKLRKSGVYIIKMCFYLTETNDYYDPDQDDDVLNIFGYYQWEGKINLKLLIG